MCCSAVERAPGSSLAAKSCRASDFQARFAGGVGAQNPISKCFCGQRSGSVRAVRHVSSRAETGPREGSHTIAQRSSAFANLALSAESPALAAGYSSLVVLGESNESSLGLLYGRNNATLMFFEAKGVAFTAVAP